MREYSNDAVATQKEEGLCIMQILIKNFLRF